ncbi:hypothetical protein [Pseudomonas sichuanensis]|uniref:hypothetical protein n=1 Tax=Pseudomonas sichuanensis TaxID=2213015 RepID=UPI000DA6A871|nr:hypothetical protein [Pseudomonas sichuanensis]
MARLTLNQTNFTAGEISPRMYGRVDIARYQNGAMAVENAWPVVHGGAMRRYGTLYCAAAKYPNKLSIVIPYVFNTQQAYIVEFGDLYVRFFFPNGSQIESSPGVPLELVSPYTEAMLRELEYVQGADTMFIFHPSVPIHRLRRVTNTAWTLAPAPFVTTPFSESGIKFTTSATLSDASVGIGRTFTSSASAFLAADVGRQITAGGGIAEITSVTSATVATVTVLVAFASTSITAWDMTLSPQTVCTPSAKDPVGSAITLSLSVAGWRPSDVGKFVKINEGLVKISSYTNATAVGAIIKVALTSTVGSSAGAWSLESSVWDAVNGYPATGTLYEQRLACGGSTNYPQTVWMSRTGEYLNFESGTKDDDAMSFTIASDQINPISHMSQVRALIALTYGGEFTLIGGVEKPITPTNVQVKNQSAYGCNKVRPVRIGNELYFVQRSNRKLRAMAYKYDSDAFGSPDMSVLSEHATESGIVSMTYQQEPESILFMVRNDGVMATMTVDRDQDVVGWARQITDGSYESVASIPTADGDQVFAVVRRVVNGATVRYIERFVDGCHVDAGVSASNPAGQTVWGGLSHLEGKIVDVVADGVPMPQMAVTAGQITLPRSAKTLQAGLHYTTRVKTLTPEVQGQGGSAQGNSMRVGEITLRFLNTTGCRVTGQGGLNQVVTFRNFGSEVLDQPPPSFTGIKRLESLGWDRGEASIEITQELPLPFHLLCVIKKMTIND